MDKKDFAKRLIEIMNENNVTARELSLKVGRNPGYINTIINGRSFPSMDGFFDICEELGITPMDFFETENRYPELLSRMIPYINKINPKEAGTVIQLLEAIAKKN